MDDLHEEEEIEIGEERISLIPEIDFEGINLDGDNRESQPLLGGGSGGCTNARGCETDENSFNHFPGEFESFLICVVMDSATFLSVLCIFVLREVNNRPVGGWLRFADKV